MEKVQLFHRDMIRSVRDEVESARVDADEEFSDNLDEIVEGAAAWAHKFQHEYNQKIEDPDGIYFEI